MSVRAPIGRHRCRRIETLTNSGGRSSIEFRVFSRHSSFLFSSRRQKRLRAIRVDISLYILTMLFSFYEGITSQRTTRRYKFNFSRSSDRHRPLLKENEHVFLWLISSLPFFLFRLFVTNIAIRSEFLEIFYLPYVRSQHYSFVVLYFAICISGFYRVSTRSAKKELVRRRNKRQFQSPKHR